MGEKPDSPPSTGRDLAHLKKVQNVGSLVLLSSYTSPLLFLFWLVYFYTREKECPKESGRIVSF